MEGPKPAIHAALERGNEDDEIVVLATYTATLALRHALAELGYTKEFWED